MPSMPGGQSFARVTPTSTKSQPFSTAATQSQSTPGAGCAGAHDEVVATAERLKAPMAHTSRGKDFVEYDNPYNVGMTGLIGQASGYHAILDCDVLFQLGADFAWPQFYPDRAKIVQIDLDPTHIGHRSPRHVRRSRRYQGNPAGSVATPATTRRWQFPRVLCEAPSEDTGIGEGRNCGGPDSTISGTYMTKLINQYAAKDAVVCRGTTARRWCGRCGTSKPSARAGPSPASCTARWRAGCHRPIGLQKCQPGRQVVCMAGDGGFAMLLGESVDRRARTGADQDRHFQQRQAWIYRNRAKIGVA